jgi:alpha-tubulin suppressor-like RCC1 family protein
MTSIKKKDKLGNRQKNQKNTKEKGLATAAYGVEAIINKGRGEKTAFFSYSPFNMNDILAVECCSKTVVMLIKNGIVITWGDNCNTLGRKSGEYRSESYIPNSLKLSIKIVDIACGKDHCMMRGNNYKVYSWGSNSCGQLGLSGFPMNPNSEKEEPSEILAFEVATIINYI